MIKGLGSDIIAVARIDKAIGRNGHRFLTTIFTEQEISYCQQFHDATRHFSGRFAAKEAIVKAIGTGFRYGITWKDIEILNDSQGKPEVTLSHRMRALVGPGECLLTISHCHEYATATALWLVAS